jgi:hypothetical protein
VVPWSEVIVLWTGRSAGVSLKLTSDMGYSSFALPLTPGHFQPEAGGIAFTARIVLNLFGEQGSWNRIIWGVSLCVRAWVELSRFETPLGIKRRTRALTTHADVVRVRIDCSGQVGKIPPHPNGADQQSVTYHMRDIGVCADCLAAAYSSKLSDGWVGETKLGAGWEDWSWNVERDFSSRVVPALGSRWDFAATGCPVT